MSFHPLLRLVPPLKTKCLEIGSAKTACKITVTQKSFSITWAGNPTLYAIDS